MTKRSQTTAVADSATPERGAPEQGGRTSIERLPFEDPWEMHRFFPHIPKGERGGHGGVPAM